MAESTGSGTRSCLMAIGIGCLAVVVLGMACAGTGYVALQRSIPPDPTPVAVEGDCPVEPAEAYLEGRRARAMAVLGPLEDLGGSSESVDEIADLVAEIDVEAMRAGRDEAAAMDVPPCAEGALAAEVALYDLALETIERLRDCDGAICTASVMFRLVTQVEPAIEQLDAAHQALGAELGVEVESLQRIIDDALGDDIRIDIE